MKQFKNKCIYRCNPDAELISARPGQNILHCRNWYFVANKLPDGSWIMIDTYYHTKHIQVTDDNADRFLFVMDPSEVKPVNSYEEYELYSDDDRIGKVPMDSGGYKFAKWYVKRDAQTVTELVIEYMRQRIRDLKRQIHRLEQEIVTLGISDN